jgi:hypothetical protein
MRGRRLTPGRRLWALLGCAGAAVGAVAVAPGAAAQSSTCTFDAPEHDVFIAVRAPGTTVSRSAGGQLLLNGEACGEATVTSVDTVHLSWYMGGGGLVVSLEHGPLAPGFTDEPGASDEIEIRGDSPEVPHTGVGPGILTIEGSEQGERIAAGLDRLNLNAHEPDGVDSDAFGFGYVRMYGRGGDDQLHGQGAPGTTISAVYVEAFGGDGDDELVGGEWDDELHGGAGSDRLGGAGDQDRLFGDAGDDELIGGADEWDLDDRLSGGDGTDMLEGGPGH